MMCPANFPKLFKQIFSTSIRSSHQRCSIKNGVFKNFAKFPGKHLCQRCSQMLFKIGVFKDFAIFTKKRVGVAFNRVAAANLFKKTLTQMFYCGYCGNFKSSFFCRTCMVAPSNVSLTSKF